METWHVYQLRSDTELLYVGYTRRLKRRLYEHSRFKTWWSEVTGVNSEKFASEDKARQREKEIWATGQPKYNKRSPFLTDEEHDALSRSRARDWRLANPGRKREADREYQRQLMADPEAREAELIRKRDSWQRNKHKRPTTVAGRRLGSRRWQQPGPGLF